MPDLRDRYSRYRAIRYAMQFVGQPYIWGGDDPVEGFDCSGFKVEVLKSDGTLPRRGDWSSRGLFREFQKRGLVVTAPGPGHLVFYASNSRPDYITHVEMCLDGLRAIGASGGGSKTLTREDAIRDNAYIKIRPIERGRPIVGYVDPWGDVR